MIAEAAGGGFSGSALAPRCACSLLKTVLNIVRPSALQSICDHNNFLPGQSDKVFSLRRSKGLTMIKDYLNVTFATFEHLYKTFYLSQSQFFQYLQVRHYIRDLFNEFQELPQDHYMYDLLGQPTNAKQLVTRFICLFVSHLTVSSDHIKVAWENETGNEYLK